MTVTRASLLLRIRDPEDRGAWKDFDAIYRPMLYSFARRMALGDADAEDVVQQCMDSVSRHIKSFEYDPHKGRFKGWLRTLVNNKARNLKRARRGHQAETQVLENVEGAEPLPEEIFDELWLKAHLRHALILVREEVDEKTFNAYQSYAVNGDTAQAVCKHLGLNRNQLYAMKFRVTRKIHQKLKILTDGEQEDRLSDQNVIS